jgi:hypothetical protein
MVSVLVMGASISPAAAAEDPAEKVAELVSEVAPFQGVVESVDSNEDGFDTDTIQLPESSDGSIAIEGGDQRALEVNLPEEADVAEGTVTSDGTVVYSSPDASVDVAAQVLDDATVRIQTVINDSSAPHEFTYELGAGYKVAEAADGTLWAYAFNDAGEIQMYGIGGAWARDANGATVDTHYEISNDSLVQVVTPTEDTVYPVVADPTWQWYNAAYGAGFSKKETRNLTNLGGVAGFCSGLAKWGTLAVACGIAGAQWWTQAGMAVNANGCVFIAAVPAPIAMRWLSKQCK